MSDLINTFDEFMETHREQNEENNNIPRTILDSKALNEQRYFTIKKSGFNIPCAVTSKVIDEEEARVKLKIHTMPYIAGVFILSAKDHKLVAFNESISKNLFGFNEQQLLNQPIVKIIPNFEKIMQFIAKNLKNLKFLPGLVLPEHFFRQMDCLIQNQKDDSFLNSIGLDGIHADGSLINVDLQLRCTQSDTLVLWITHSRTVFDSKFEKKNRVTFKEKNEEELKYEELEKAQRNSKQTAFGEEGEYDQDGALPSQLSLLKEHDINFRSATSSVRSDLHTASSSTSSTTTSASTVSKQSSTSDIRELTSVSGSKASSSEISNDVNLETYKMLDSNMSEEALLKIENDTIQRQKSTSKYYPKTIGLKRREKSFKEFIVLKKMGQGAYGNVVLAENKNDPNYRIVIKLVIKERILVDTWVRDRKLGTIPSEIQIMSLLNNNPHPNIMRLIDFFEDDDYYYIETPQHGFPTPAIDLFDMIELKGSMSEDECKSIIKQAVSAIKHLHKNGVVHRDIKDENLIIDSNGVTKLIDFGSAACIKHGPFDVFVGTLDYAAPEVLNGQPYDGKPQDVWSLGILIYTLIYKENPFYNVDEIMEGELRIPFVMSEGSLNLIKKILQRDIQKRPKMEEIISDSWLST
jgi:protein-serine/threonine kinase